MFLYLIVHLADHFTDIWESLSRSLDPLQFDSVPLYHQNGDSFTASIVAKSFLLKMNDFPYFKLILLTFKIQKTRVL